MWGGGGGGEWNGAETTPCHKEVDCEASSGPLGFFGFFLGGGGVCVPQLYLWGSPLLGEIFAYVTVF